MFFREHQNNHTVNAIKTPKCNKKSSDVALKNVRCKDDFINNKYPFIKAYTIYLMYILQDEIRYEKTVFVKTVTYL